MSGWNPPLLRLSRRHYNQLAWPSRVHNRRTFTKFRSHSRSRPKRERGSRVAQVPTFRLCGVTLRETLILVITKWLRDVVGSGASNLRYMPFFYRSARMFRGVVELSSRIERGNCDDHLNPNDERQTLVVLLHQAGSKCVTY